MLTFGERVTNVIRVEDYERSVVVRRRRRPFQWFGREGFESLLHTWGKCSSSVTSSSSSSSVQQSFRIFVSLVIKVLFLEKICIDKKTNHFSARIDLENSKVGPIIGLKDQRKVHVATTSRRCPMISCDRRRR